MFRQSDFNLAWKDPLRNPGDDQSSYSPLVDPAVRNIGVPGYADLHSTGQRKINKVIDVAMGTPELAVGLISFFVYT